MAIDGLGRCLGRSRVEVGRKAAVQRVGASTRVQTGFGLGAVPDVAAHERVCRLALALGEGLRRPVDLTLRKIVDHV